MDVVRKTFKYKLAPTPAQAQILEVVLSRCRALYNVALEQRKTWWGRGQGKGATYYQQKAELRSLKAACPEYTDVHAHVLQDVILRLDRAFQAFFRRIQTGEKAGYPRFQGAGRFHSFTFPEYGNGAALDGGVLSLSKIGRIPIRLHRPLQGTQRPSPSRGKPTAGTPTSPVLKRPPSRFHLPVRRPGLTWAWSRLPCSPMAP
jgi:putative transposase